VIVLVNDYFGYECHLVMVFFAPLWCAFCSTLSIPLIIGLVLAVDPPFILCFESIVNIVRLKHLPPQSYDSTCLVKLEIELSLSIKHG
jgi:hypothetical protein